MTATDSHVCTGGDCTHESHREPRWAYKKGLHALGNGAWAWLQPDGSWGWSNAGLITDGDASLLVDTLFDVHLTAEMLAAMHDAAGVGAEDVDVLVNTHANGDHTFGNSLITDARIIASAASLHQMEEESPKQLAGMMSATGKMGDVGAYLARIFAPFDFAACEAGLPNETFSGRMSVKVGGKDVDLYEVGPAHTMGDVIVHSKSDGVVYTGDILFIDGTPIMWAGPVDNWIRACDLILELDAAVIVPGHGPITDARGVRRVQDYLRHIDKEARARFDAGMSASDAAFDIALGDFAAWGDAERIAVNVLTLYRGYRGGADDPSDPVPFRLMAELDKRGPKR